MPRTNKHNALPIPQAWANAAPQGWNPVANTCEEELNEMVLQGRVPIAIADAGVSFSCGMQYESECGTY